MSDNDSDSTNDSSPATTDVDSDPTAVSEDPIDVSAPGTSNDIPVSSSPTPAQTALASASETVSQDDDVTQASSSTTTEYEGDYSDFPPFSYESNTLYTDDIRETAVPLPTFNENMPLYTSAVVNPATFVYDNTDPVHFYPPLLAYTDDGAVNVPMPTMAQKFYHSELVIPAADVGSVNIEFPTDMTDTDRYRLVFYPAFSRKSYNDLIPPLSKKKMEHIKQNHYLLYDTSTSKQKNTKAIGFLTNNIHFYTAAGWFVWQQLIKKVWSTRSTLALYVTLDDSKFTRALFSKNRHMVFHFPHHLDPKVPYTLDQAQNSRNFSFTVSGEASSGNMKELLKITQQEYVDINLDVSQKHIIINFTYLIVNSNGTKVIFTIGFDPVHVVQFKYLHLEGIDAVCQLECAPIVMIDKITGKKTSQIPSWTAHVPDAMTPGLYPLADENEANSVTLYAKALEEKNNKIRITSSTFKKSFFDVQSQLIFVVNDIEPKIVYVCGWTVGPINITIPALGMPVELRLAVPLSSPLAIEWQRQNSAITIKDTTRVEIPINFAEDLGIYAAVFKKGNDIVLQQNFDIQVVSAPMSSLAPVVHGPVVESLTALVGLDKAYSVFAATYPQYYQYAVALDNLFSRYQDNSYVQLIESLPKKIMDKIEALPGDSGQHFFPPYIHYHPPLSMLPNDGNEYFIIYDTLKRQWVNLMGDASVSGMLFDKSFWPKTDMAIRSSDAHLTSTPVVDAARKSIDVLTKVVNTPFQLVDQVPVVLLSLELNQPFERLADDIAYQMGKISPVPNYSPLVTPALQDYVRQNVVDRYLTPRQQKLVLAPNASQTDLNLAARIITPSQIRTIYPSIKAHVVSPNPFVTVGSDISVSVSRNVSSLLTSSPFDDKAQIGGRIRAFTKFNPNEVTVQKTVVINGLVQTVAETAEALPEVPVAVFEQASTSIVPIIPKPVVAVQEQNPPTLLSFPNRPFVSTSPIAASSTLIDVGGIKIRQATTPVVSQPATTSTGLVRDTPKPIQLFTPAMTSVPIVPLQRDFSKAVVQTAPQPLFGGQAIPFQRDFPKPIYTPLTGTSGIIQFGGQALPFQRDFPKSLYTTFSNPPLTGTSGTSQLGRMPRKELQQPSKTTLQRLDALVNDKLIYIPVSVNDAFRFIQPVFRPYGKPLEEIISQPQPDIHDNREKNLSEPFELPIPRVPWDDVYFSQTLTDTYDENDVLYQDCQKLLDDYNAFYQKTIDQMRVAARNAQNNTAYSVLRDIRVPLQILFERSYALQHLDTTVVLFSWTLPGWKIEDELALLNNYMRTYIKVLMEKDSADAFAPLDFETLFNAYIVTFNLNEYINLEWNYLTLLAGGDTEAYIQHIVKEALYSYHDRPRVFVENMLKIDGVNQYAKDKSLVEFTWGTFRILNALFSVLQILTLSSWPDSTVVPDEYRYGANLLRDVATKGLVKYFISEPTAALTESKIGAKKGTSTNDDSEDDESDIENEESDDAELDIEDELAEGASSSDAPPLPRTPSKKSVGIERLSTMDEAKIKNYMEKYTVNKTINSLQDLIQNDTKEENEIEPTVTELFWNDVLLRSGTVSTIGGSENKESLNDIVYNFFKRMIDDDNTNSVLPIIYYASKGAKKFASPIDVANAWNEFTFHESSNNSQALLMSLEFINLLADYPADMIRANFPNIAFQMLNDAVAVPDSYLIRSKLEAFFKTFVDNSLGRTIEPSPWKEQFVRHFALDAVALNMSYNDIIKQIYAKYVDETRTNSIKEEVQILIAQYMSQLDIFDDNQYKVYEAYQRAALEIGLASNQVQVQNVMETLLSLTPPSVGKAKAQTTIIHNKDDFEQQKEINLGKQAKFIENFNNVPYERLRDVGYEKRAALLKKARSYNAKDAVNYLTDFYKLLELETNINSIFGMYEEADIDALTETIRTTTHVPTQRYFQKELADAKAFNDLIQQIRNSTVVKEVEALGKQLVSRTLPIDVKNMCTEIVFVRTRYLTYLDFYKRAEDGEMPDRKFVKSDFDAFVQKLGTRVGPKQHLRSDLGNISREQREDLRTKMQKYDKDARAYTLFNFGPNPSVQGGYNTWSFEQFVAESSDLGDNLFDKSFIHGTFKGSLNEYIERTQATYTALLERIENTDTANDDEKKALYAELYNQREFLPVSVYRQLEQTFTKKFGVMAIAPAAPRIPSSSSSPATPPPTPTPQPEPQQEPEPEQPPPIETVVNTSNAPMVAPRRANVGDKWQNPGILDEILKPSSTKAAQYVMPSTPSFMKSDLFKQLSILRKTKWTLAGGAASENIINMDNIKAIFDGKINDILSIYDAKNGTDFASETRYYPRALLLAERAGKITDTEILVVDDTNTANVISFDDTDLRMFFIAAALLSLFFHNELSDNATAHAFSGPTSATFTLLLMLYPKLRTYVASVNAMGTWNRFFKSLNVNLRAKINNKDVFDPKVWTKVNFKPFYLNDSYSDTTHKATIENAIYTACMKHIQIEGVNDLESFKASSVVKAEHRYTIQELIEPASMITFDNSRTFGKIDYFIFFQFGWWRRIAAFLGKNYQTIQTIFDTTNPFIDLEVIEPTPAPEPTSSSAPEASTSTSSARLERAAKKAGQQPNAFKGMQS